jgi:bifunctional UDP-N-acetylglucosamine pyrophosphorylase/glucosamine-1-phosphate N-acetyltransferase
MTQTQLTLSNCGIIILAAGQGKRMRSKLPKVLHEIGGKPLLFHVLERVREVSPMASILIVVGHGREQVEAFVRGEARFQKMDISFVIQSEQKGTGHAARCAMDSSWGDKRVQEKSPILVLPGDLPLLSSRLLEQVLASLKKDEVIRLLTCRLPNPTGYGRIVRKGKTGPVLRIVEERDASPKEKAIDEVGTSIYFFQSLFLKNSLKKLSNKNAQGEYYLTDVIAQASQLKKKIQVLCWSDHDDLRGVNDLWELTQADQILNRRSLCAWAVLGTRFLDPQTTKVDVTVQFEEGVVVHPGAILKGLTQIGKESVIGEHVVLNHVRVGEHANIKTGTVAEQSEIGNHAQIGPYAHLRPESVVGVRVKIGNFVELKKSRIGDNTSIAHLSYLGDAEVGRNVNIGCGFVTCNFDGRVVDGARKHRTIIEDDVFLGSDCQAVAPVKIGQGAYVASGSTITKDVQAGDLAIARSRQVNKAGYARRLRALGKNSSSLEVK